MGGRAGDPLQWGQALAHKLGYLPQAASRDDDCQVEGAAHQIHALHLVILIDALGDAVKSGDTLCVIYDLSYLEMVINVDELQISSLSVGQKVQITADAVQDKNYVGTVTRVSMKGASNGGTTTYPVTIRIDETDGLRPGMNANAEIVVAEAANALTVPNAAIVRGGYVLVTQDSPSASKADTTMEAPEGFVYVAVKTGVSDDDYTQIVSGIQEGDTIGYDPNSVSSDSYYDDGSGMMIF